MLDEEDLEARMTVLTMAVQALYATHPNREAVVGQLQQLADGANEIMQAYAISNHALARLRAYLADFIAALR